ncbi:substrate-binding and VWA domain-containing protein [Rhodococcus sp. Eu-32]|uniref:substrate-binding and VWA domain-containing protein n=1 Tax=Rhodococcus sp. Eu-32 TaxID=1017319 RepID=UPI001FB33625|nr:substrate-binding and VWA domain-containing protein [Rhodococcus sp. Eu-32]
MGEHRTSGGSRGISKGPVIAAGIIIVVVLAVFGWFQLRDRIADQGVQAASTCVEGPLTLPVTVDPDISPMVTELAARFDATNPIVRDHCVTVDVATTPTAAMASAVAAGPDNWDPAALGAVPALWIPRSSDALQGVPPGTIDGTPRSVASSPIVLAGPDAVTSALSAGSVGWADLPRLQRASDGLDALGLPGWGGLRLQVPTGPDAASTSPALAAVAATTVESPTGSLSLEQARSGAVVSAMSALATTDRGQSAVSVDSTDAVLARISADPSPNSDVHTVPVTAQQLRASAQTGLSTYAPVGATPVADHPAAILGSGFSTDTLDRAAAQFVEFVRQPANATVFSDAGFDVGDIEAEAAATASDTRQALIDAVRDPATPRRATVLLDVSGSMDTTEGARTRLQNTVDALNQQFESVVGASDLGLWVYSANLDGQRAFRTAVPTGPLDEQIASGTRRDALVSAASALRPETSTSTYESVVAAYVDAVDNYVPGRPNSVVLVTDGPNDDASISSDRFLRMLSDLAEPDKPVAIDVVSIGTNSDIRTLQSMSDTTGGSTTTVGSSDGPELLDLLRKLLY